MQIYKTVEEEGRAKTSADEAEGLTVVHITKAHELQGTEDEIFQKVRKLPLLVDCGNCLSRVCAGD